MKILIILFLNYLIYFYPKLTLYTGTSVKKYCLDVAIKTEFEYLEDAIFSFQMLPSESSDGCKTIRSSNSSQIRQNKTLMENNYNETLTICICDQDKCNSANRERISFKSSAITILFFVISTSLFEFRIL